MGGTYIGQPVYINGLSEEAGYEDKADAASPMVRGWKHDEKAPALNEEDRQFYVTFVMRLVWIATNTRPDLSFAANTLARSLNKVIDRTWVLWTEY